MKLSAFGRAVLEFAETLVLRAYPDSGGVWTIGYGHTKGVRPGMTCTAEQADAWLAEDVSEAEAAVTTHVRVPLSQREFDALVMFAFNVGITGFEGSTLLKLLNADDALNAATQFLVWDKVRGVENVGLERRRTLEKAMFLDGVPQ